MVHWPAWSCLHSDRRRWLDFSPSFRKPAALREALRRVCAVVSAQRHLHRPHRSDRRHLFCHLSCQAKPWKTAGQGFNFLNVSKGAHNNNCHGERWSYKNNIENAVRREQGILATTRSAEDNASMCPPYSTPAKQPRVWQRVSLPHARPACAPTEPSSNTSEDLNHQHISGFDLP